MVKIKLKKHKETKGIKPKKTYNKFISSSLKPV
jgi:hypothetical protein